MKETGGGVWNDASLRESLSEAEEGIRHRFLERKQKGHRFGGLFVTPLPFSGRSGGGGPLARMGRAQLYRARSASTGTTPRCSVPYVPISHDARYFTCSFVSVSIFIPMPASLRRAISLSITGGTG